MKTINTYINESLNEALSEDELIEKAEKKLNDKFDKMHKKIVSNFTDLLHKAKVFELSELESTAAYKFNDEDAYDKVMNTLYNMQLDKACYINIDKCNDKESYIKDGDYEALVADKYPQTATRDIQFLVGYSDNDMLIIITVCSFDGVSDWASELNWYRMDSDSEYGKYIEWYKIPHVEDNDLIDFGQTWKNWTNDKWLPKYRAFKKVGDALNSVKDKYIVL